MSDASPLFQKSAPNAFSYMLTSARQNDIDALLPLVRHRRRARLRLADHQEIDCELTCEDARTFRVTLVSHLEPRSPVALLVDGYNARHVVALAFAHAQAPEQQARQLVLKPARSLVFNRREARRTRAPTCWHLQLPLHNEIFACPVRDVSFGGLSVFVAQKYTHQHQFSAGTHFAAVLQIGEEARGKLALRIIHHDQQTGLLRLQLRGYQSASKLCWARRVGALLQPAISCSDDASLIWALLLESGFLALGGKSEKDFLPKQKTFASCLKKAQDLSHSFIWSEDQIPVATSTNTRAFDHTVVAHQLAVIPGRKNGRLVLRELFTHTIESIKYDRSISYFAAFLSASATIHQVAFLDFALQHRASGLSVHRPFRLVEVVCATGPIALHPAKEARVFAPTEEMYQESFKKRPEWAESLFWEAFDLTPKRIMGAKIHNRWDREGLFRARGLLGYRDEQGHIIAFLAMDVTEPGASLFGLFDQVYFLPVSMKSDSKTREQALRSLLLMARQFYQQHGRTHFSFAAMNDLVPNSFLENMNDFSRTLANGTLVLFHRKIWGVLQEYWHRLFAPARERPSPRSSDSLPPTSHDLN